MPNILYLFVFHFIFQSCSPYELSIVHLNDVHSYFLESNPEDLMCSDDDHESKRCFGGLARQVTKIKEIRAQEKNVLALASGDFYLADSYHPYHGWKLASVLLPYLHLNATGFGNHDFDSNVRETMTYAYSLKWPVVATNLIGRAGSLWQQLVHKSIVLDVGGEKIGIVGYITPFTKYASRTGVSFSFADEIPSLKDEVKKLEDSGVNKIIALGHSNFHIDQIIAENVPGIDVIVGGNSEVFFRSGTGMDSFEDKEGLIGRYPTVVTRHNQTEDSPADIALLVQVPQHGRYVGHLKLEFDGDGHIVNYSGRPILLSKNVIRDPETVAAINKSYAIVLRTKTNYYHLPPYDEILTKLPVDLDGDFIECRMRECTLGNMIADSMVHCFANRKDDVKTERVDGAVWNAGSIKSSLRAGNVTFLDLTFALYLGDMAVLYKMNGSQLRRMMEHAVAKYDPTGIAPPGSFLQVSRMRVEYDLSKPPGQRVVSLMVLCSRCKNETYRIVRRNQIYNIAVPQYFLQGGDRFFHHHGNRLNPNDITDGAAVAAFLQESTPSTEVEGRIKFRYPNLENASDSTANKLKRAINHHRLENGEKLYSFFESYEGSEGDHQSNPNISLLGSFDKIEISQPNFNNNSPTGNKKNATAMPNATQKSSENSTSLTESFNLTTSSVYMSAVTSAPVESMNEQNHTIIVDNSSITESLVISPSTKNAKYEVPNFVLNSTIGSLAIRVHNDTTADSTEFSVTSHSPKNVENNITNLNNQTLVPSQQPNVKHQNHNDMGRKTKKDINKSSGVMLSDVFKNDGDDDEQTSNAVIAHFTEASDDLESKSTVTVQTVSTENNYKPESGEDSRSLTKMPYKNFSSGSTQNSLEQRSANISQSNIGRDYMIKLEFFEKIINGPAENTVASFNKKKEVTNVTEVNEKITVPNSDTVDIRLKNTSASVSLIRNAEFVPTILSFTDLESNTSASRFSINSTEATSINVDLKMEGYYITSKSSEDNNAEFPTKTDKDLTNTSSEGKSNATLEQDLVKAVVDDHHPSTIKSSSEVVLSPLNSTDIKSVNLSLKAEKHHNTSTGFDDYHANFTTKAREDLTKTSFEGENNDFVEQGLAIVIDHQSSSTEVSSEVVSTVLSLTDLQSNVSANPADDAVTKTRSQEESNANSTKTESTKVHLKTEDYHIILTESNSNVFHDNYADFTTKTNEDITKTSSETGSNSSLKQDLVRSNVIDNRSSSIKSSSEVTSTDFSLADLDVSANLTAKDLTDKTLRDGSNLSSTETQSTEISLKTEDYHNTIADKNSTSFQDNHPDFTKVDVDVKTTSSEEGDNNVFSEPNNIKAVADQHATYTLNSSEATSHYNNDTSGNSSYLSNNYFEGTATTHTTTNVANTNESNSDGQTIFQNVIKIIPPPLHRTFKKDLSSQDRLVANVSQVSELETDEVKAFDNHTANPEDENHISSTASTFVADKDVSIFSLTTELSNATSNLHSVSKNLNESSKFDHLPSQIASTTNKIASSANEAATAPEGE